jgi:hypothetical protein
VCSSVLTDAANVGWLQADARQGGYCERLHLSGDMTRVCGVVLVADGDVGDPLAIRVAARFSIVYGQAS